MRILVLGAGGLLGSSIAAHLRDEGHEIVAGYRTRPARAPAGMAARQAEFAHLRAPEDWRSLLEGVDAVVNAAGALQDSPRDSLALAHVNGPRVLIAACERFHVRRLVLISAAGIANSDTSFAVTKREGENLLENSALEWVILRPGLVVASNAYGGTALLRALAALPLLPVIPAAAPIQIVTIGDLCAAVAFAVSDAGAVRRTFEILVPAKLPFLELLSDYRNWLGLKPAQTITIARPILRFVSVLADFSAPFGWRSPMRTTALRQLVSGVEGDPGSWLEASGARPTSLRAWLDAHPAGVAEKWFARLYLLKPVALVSMSLFWLWSGLVALGPGYRMAESFLELGGMGETWAPIVTALGGLFDIMAAVALLIRPVSKLVLSVMIGACFVYLTAGTLLCEGCWYDPLGAYAKIVPVVIALFFMRAIADER